MYFFEDLVWTEGAFCHRLHYEVFGTALGICKNSLGSRCSSSNEIPWPKEQTLPAEREMR
jgi:hypothetical protein